MLINNDFRGANMDNLIDKLVTAMIKNNVIEEDEEIIRTGLNILIIKICFIFVVILIGIFADSLIESLVFTISYSLLREYGGGYHAETKGKCFVLSVLTLIAALCIIKFMVCYQTLTLPFFAAAVISALYIFLKAPIDTANKRLDEAEIRVYGKRARLLTVILAVVSAVLWLIGSNALAFAVLMGIIAESYLMLKGQIVNLIKREAS